jgi:hypothetical protein
MDSEVARNIAHYSHKADRDRFGDPLVEHVERVASAVPPEARALAFLHDVLERTDTTVDELRVQGLTDEDLKVLELLTRDPGEVYELHCLQIAWAGGHAGVLARAIKLADVDDHLGHKVIPDDAPPYAWARRHIKVASERRNDAGQLDRSATA